MTLPCHWPSWNQGALELELIIELPIGAGKPLVASTTVSSFLGEGRVDYTFTHPMYCVIIVWSIERLL